jgi:predicted negative regulator of RcsB-dependent stress response
LGAKKIKIDKSKAKAMKGDSRLSNPPDWSERAKDWLDLHYREMTGAVLVLFLLFIGFYGYRSYEAGKGRRAQAAYATAIERWPSGDSSDPKQFEPVAAELEKLANRYQGTEAALNARLDLSRADFRMGRYEDSLKQAEGVLREISNEHDLEPLARYQVALAYEALGKTDQAIEQWDLVRSKGMSGLGREADWHLGRLYSGKQEYAKAAEAYERALQAPGSYPNTALIEQNLDAVRTKVATKGEVQQGAPSKGQS